MIAIWTYIIDAGGLFGFALAIFVIYERVAGLIKVRLAYRRLTAEMRAQDADRARLAQHEASVGH